MNGDDLGQKAVAAGRRLIRFSALVLLLVALASLAACAFAYFKSDFLRPDVVLTPEAADKMRKVVALAMFRVIPGLSILLILSASLIWKLSGRK